MIPEEEAYQLITKIQKAVHLKDRESYMSLISRRSSQLPFEELMKLKIPKIPVFQITEVENVDISHYPYMLFFGLVGLQKVGFRAKYSVENQRYLLDDQSVLDSIFDQKKLAELVAQNLMERFGLAKEKRSLRVLEEVVADEFTLIDCQKRRSYLTREKYLESVLRDGLHNFEEFKISKLNYNFFNGTMDFIVSSGDSIKNHVEVEQKNGVFLMVLEHHLKC